MKLPVQITFRNIPPSEIVEEWIRAEVEKLETFYQRPVNCRVAVEVPHRHHRRGRPYHVRVEITLPRGQVVANRAPNLGKLLQQSGDAVVHKHLELDRGHKELRLSINEAFHAAARQLSEYARRRRGEVKIHRAASGSDGEEGNREWDVASVKCGREAG